MENKNMKENAVVIDEKLENVSGGANTSDEIVTCYHCGQKVHAYETVNRDGRYLCADCLRKQYLS